MKTKADLPTEQLVKQKPKMVFNQEDYNYDAECNADLIYTSAMAKAIMHGLTPTVSDMVDLADKAIKAGKIMCDVKIRLKLNLFEQEERNEQCD